VKLSQKELALSAHELTMLQQDKLNLENQLSASREDIAQLQHANLLQLEQLRGSQQEEIAGMRLAMAAMKSAHDKETNSLNSQLEISKENLARFEKERLSLLESMDTIKSDRVEMAQAIARLEAEKKELNKKLSNTVSSLEQMTTATIHDIKSRLAEKESMLHAETEKHQAVNANVRALQAENVKLRESTEGVTRLERQLSEANESIAKAALRIRAQEEQIGILQKVVAENKGATMAIADHQAENANLRAQIEDLKTQLREVVETSETKLKTQLQSQLTAHEEATRQLETQHLQALATVESACKERELLTENHHRRLLASQEDLDESHANELASFNLRMVNIQQENEQSLAALTKLRDEEKHDFEHKVEQFERDVAELTRKHKDDLEKAKETERNLSASLETIRKETSSQLDAITRSACEAEQGHATEVAQLKLLLEEMKTTVREKEAAVARLERSNDLSNNAVENMKLSSQNILQEELTKQKAALEAAYELDKRIRTENFQLELERSVAAAANEARSKYQGQLKEAILSHKLKLEEMFAERERSIRKREEEIDRIIAVSVSQETTEKLNTAVAAAVEAERVKAVANTRATVEACKEALASDYEDRLKRQLEECRFSVETQMLERVESCRVDTSAVIESARSQWLTEREQLERNMRDDHEQEVIALTDKLTKALDSVRSQRQAQEQETALLQKQHTENLERMRKSMMEEFDSKGKSLGSELRRSLEQEYAAKSQQAEERMRAELVEEQRQKLIVAQEEVEKHFRTDFETKLSLAKIAVTREATDEYNRKLQEVKSRFSSELLQVKTMHAENIAAINTQHETSKKRDIEAAVGSVRSESDYLSRQVAEQHQNDLDVQQSKYKALIKDKDLQVDNLRSEILLINAKCRDEWEATLKARMEDLKLEHESRMSQTRQLHETLLASKVEELQSGHSRELSRLKSSLESAHSIELAAVHENFAKTKEQHVEAMATAATVRREQEMRIIKADREKFDKLLQEALDERNEMHAASRQSLMQTAEAEKLLLVNLRESDKERYESELKSKAKQHKEEVHELEQQWSQKLAQEINTKEEYFREVLAEQAEQMTANFKKVLAETRVQEKMNADQQLSVLLQQREQSEEALNELSLSLTKQRADFEQEKLALRLQYKNSMAELEQRLVRDSSSEASELVAKYEALRREYMEESSVALETLKVRHQQAVDAATVHFNDRLSRREDEHRSLVEGLKARLEDSAETRLAAMRDEHEAELLAAQNEVRRLQGQLASAEENLSSVEQRLAAAISEKESVIDVCNKSIASRQTLQDEKNELDSKVSELTADHQSMLKAYQAKIQSIEQQKQAEISSVRSELEQRVAALSVKLQQAATALEELGQHKISLQQELEASVAKHEHAVSSLRLEMEAHVSRLQMEVLKLDTLVESKTKELEILRGQHEAELKASTASIEDTHQKQFAELKRKFEIERDEALAAVAVAASDAAINSISEFSQQTQETVRGYQVQLEAATAIEFQLFADIAALKENAEDLSKVLVQRDNDLLSVNSSKEVLLSEMQQQVASRDQDIQNLRDQVSALQSQLELQSAEALDLRTKLESEVVASSQSRDEAEQIRQQLALQDAVVLELEHQKALVNERVLSLQVELESSREQLMITKGTLETASAAVIVEQENRQEKELEIATLRHSLLEMKAGLEALKQSSGEALEESSRDAYLKNEAVNELTVRIGDFESEISELCKANEALSHQLDQAKLQCESLEATALQQSEFTERLAHAEAERCALAANNDSLIQELAILKQQVEELKNASDAQREASTTSISLYTDMLDAAKSEVEGKDRELSQVSDLLATERQRLVMMFRQVQTLDEQRISAEKQASTLQQSLNRCESEKSELDGLCQRLKASLTETTSQLEATKAQQCKHIDASIEVALSEMRESHHRELTMALINKENEMQKQMFAVMQDQVGNIFALLKSQNSSNSSLQYVQGKPFAVANLLLLIISAFTVELHKQTLDLIQQQTTKKDSSEPSAPSTKEGKADQEVTSVDRRQEATREDEYFVRVVGEKRAKANQAQSQRRTSSGKANDEPMYVITGVVPDDTVSVSTARVSTVEFVDPIPAQSSKRNSDRVLTRSGSSGLLQAGVAEFTFAGTPHALPILPWTSPTERSAPVDQLTAAILDGDCEGIVKVVSSGPSGSGGLSNGSNTLRSEFWAGLCASTLPLHRAVSGLHFHGSEKLVVNTLETLLGLGADVNACDQAGNSVLHKAISVCTSQSIVPVVAVLLAHGAKVTIVCKEGFTPLHLECWKCRSASSEVIRLLLKAGANVNAVSKSTRSLPDDRNPQPQTATADPRKLTRTASEAFTSGGSRQLSYPLEKDLTCLTLLLLKGYQQVVSSASPAGREEEDNSNWLRVASLLIECGKFLMLYDGCL
jgi:chromosome segregation ATPase